MHGETKATAIPQSVKKAVYERDGGRCIICRSYSGQPDAHYIARAHGGRGIEQNIVTLCPRCHRTYDQTDLRKVYGEQIKAYLDEHYPGFPDEKRVYHKYD